MVVWISKVGNIIFLIKLLNAPEVTRWTGSRKCSINAVPHSRSDLEKEALDWIETRCSQSLQIKTRVQGYEEMVPHVIKLNVLKALFQSNILPLAGGSFSFSVGNVPVALEWFLLPTILSFPPSFEPGELSGGIHMGTASPFLIWSGLEC